MSTKPFAFLCTYCNCPVVTDRELVNSRPLMQWEQEAFRADHQAICDDYLTVAARALIAEVELHLSKRCDFVRHGTSGAVYRCRRYACDGFHDMAREGA